MKPFRQFMHIDDDRNEHDSQFATSQTEEEEIERKRLRRNRCIFMGEEIWIR
jgi:hypothetical protein